MEVNQNLSAIKVEPVEIKSETEGELLVGITAQSIAGGQECEDTLGPILRPGIIKTEPTKIKSEPKDEPSFVESTSQDLIGGGQNIKKERDKVSQERPKEPQIQADYQSELYELDDNKRLVMKYTLGESQSESESVNLSMIEKEDEPEFIKLPLSKVSPSEYTILESKRVQCNYCGASHESVSKIRRHIRGSHREPTKLYKCPFCPYTSKREVSRHIISKHKGDKDIEYFVCHTCGHRSKFKRHLIRHVKSHRTVEELMQTNEMYKCEQCPKMFRYKDSLIKHTKYYHNENDESQRVLQCDHCAYRCRSREHLMSHIQKKHTCPKCDFTTKFLKDLNKHKYKCHGQRYQCPKCLYQTHTKAALNDHKRTHKIHKCIKCNYRTDRLSSLQSHNLTHLKPEEIQYLYCYHCNYKDKWRHSFVAHIRRHFEHEEVEFECHTCDFKTKKRHIYSRHIEEHTPVSQLKTLKCPECDFTAKSVEDFQEHKYRCHERSYQCPKCPYQTNTQATLNDHKRTHKKLLKKDKKYKCNNCHYRTYQLSNLKAHSLTHLNPEEIQYFYCYHCNFKVKWRTTFLTHIRRHFEQEEVEFECHICHFKTKKRQIYSRHIGEHNKKQKS